MQFTWLYLQTSAVSRRSAMGASLSLTGTW